MFVQPIRPGLAIYRLKIAALQAARKIMWDSHSWLSSGCKCNKLLQTKAPELPNSDRNRLFPHPAKTAAHQTATPNIEMIAARNRKV
jgi:hypothetical protein